MLILNMLEVEHLMKFYTLGKYSPMIMANLVLTTHKCTRELKDGLQVMLALYNDWTFGNLLGFAIQEKANDTHKYETISHQSNGSLPYAHLDISWLMTDLV